LQQDDHSQNLNADEPQKHKSGQSNEGMEEYEENKNDDGNPEDKDMQETDDNMAPEIMQSTETDLKSVYVKNVDYSATKEEVGEFFKSCGKVTRVTLITDKYTGQPKGFAYIEFADKEAAENAKLLSDSTFKGRVIQVQPKRTNMPFKGRGGRGARRVGRGFPSFYPVRRGYQMFSMRGGYRGRGFRPY